MHEERPIALRVAGPSEQTLIWALADVDPEMLILDLIARIASHPGDALWRDDPLWWLNPADEHLRTTPEPSRAARPNHHI
jgi:hypothetical protein